MVSANKQKKVGFYLDTENLGRNIPEKQETIIQALTDWPRDLEVPVLVTLYVTEDTNLWKSAWEKIVGDFQDSLPGMATVNLPEPVTKPAHRYSHNPNKNAADITIVLDALDDIHQNHTDFAVIFSNDSDFAGLLYKLQEVQQRDAERFSHSYGNSPFLLITHANSGRSQQLDILGRNVRTLSVPTQKEPVVSRSIPSGALDQDITVEDTTTIDVVENSATPERMAAEVAEKMYKTTFNGIEACNIIKERWPNDPELIYDAAIAPDRYSISAWFFEKIWEPVMQQHGVTIDMDASPRLYTMPHEARRQLRNPGSLN